MALGIANSGGSSGPIEDRIEYDARAGRFFRVDRSQAPSGDWVTNKVELRLPLTLLFDLENIEVGWMKLDKTGVDFRMVRVGEALGPRPEGLDANGKPAYRQGFRVRVFSPNLLGGARVFAHTAQCVIGQMDLLHDVFSKQLPSNAGKVPVVTVSDVMSVKSGQSTNYAPVLVLDKWVDRPEGFKAAERAPTTTATLSSVPATGSGHTPPPTAQPALAAAAPEF